MRVISQNGSISVDFDRTAFLRDGNCICAVVGGVSRVIGCYASDELADEIFWDMHNEKRDRGAYIYRMP